MPTATVRSASSAFKASRAGPSLNIAKAASIGPRIFCAASGPSAAVIRSLSASNCGAIDSTAAPMPFSWTVAQKSVEKSRP
jgi:hypothetical protein